MFGFRHTAIYRHKRMEKMNVVCSFIPIQDTRAQGWRGWRCFARRYNPYMYRRDPEIEELEEKAGRPIRDSWR